MEWEWDGGLLVPFILIPTIGALPLTYSCTLHQPLPLFYFCIFVVGSVSHAIHAPLPQLPWIDPVMDRQEELDYYLPFMTPEASNLTHSL